MSVIEWKEHKGFCLAYEETVDQESRESKVTNGLECLPWSSFLPEFEKDSNKYKLNDNDEEALEKEQLLQPPPSSSSSSLPSSSQSASSAPSPKKLSKLEKRELRQLKKVNAQRKRQLKRQTELEETGLEVESDTSFKPFLAKRDIKHIFTNIILNKAASETQDGEGSTNGDCSESRDEKGRRKGKAKANGNHSAKARDFKIFQYHSIAIYKSDLEHILPGEWLNDNDISFVYELITQAFINSGRCRDFANQVCLLFPSLIQLIQHFPAESIETLLPMNDLLKLKFVFLPINYIEEPLEEINLEGSNNGDHWALGVLSLLENTLYVYDSMRVDDNVNEERQLQLLCEKLENCKKLIKKGSKIRILHMQCDQQTNFDDCGVFVIMFTCYLVHQMLFKDRISFDMNKVRFNALDGRLHIMQLISNLAFSYK